MAQPPPEVRRPCPTRENGHAPLIAHWITPRVCGERQGRNYHKCFSCRYRGLGLDATLSPSEEPLVPTPRVPPARKPERPRIPSAT